MIENVEHGCVCGVGYDPSVVGIVVHEMYHGMLLALSMLASM